jgi:hypothetical protein
MHVISALWLSDQAHVAQADVRRHQLYGLWYRSVIIVALSLSACHVTIHVDNEHRECHCTSKAYASEWLI